MFLPGLLIAVAGQLGLALHEFRTWSTAPRLNFEFKLQLQTIPSHLDLAAGKYKT